MSVEAPRLDRIITIDSVNRFIHFPGRFDCHDVCASVVSIIVVLFIYGGSQRCEVMSGEVRDSEWRSERQSACMSADGIVTLSALSCCHMSR